MTTKRKNDSETSDVSKCFKSTEESNASSLVNSTSILSDLSSNSSSSLASSELNSTSILSDLSSNSSSSLASSELNSSVKDLLSLKALSPYTYVHNEHYKLLWKDGAIGVYELNVENINGVDGKVARMPSVIDLYDEQKGFNYESIKTNILPSFAKTKFTDFAIKCGDLTIFYSKFDLMKKSAVFEQLDSKTNMIEICGDGGCITNMHVLLMFAILEGCKFKSLSFDHAITIYRIAYILKFQFVLDYLVESNHLLKGYKACDDMPGLLEQLLSKHLYNISFAGDVLCGGKYWFRKLLDDIEKNKIISKSMLERVKKYVGEKYKLNV